MGIMRRKLLYVLFPVLYVIGALGDNIFTYYYVCVLGVFSEANPFRAHQVYTQPLWMWFIRDLLMLAIAIALTFLYKKLMERDTRTLRLADRAWVILAVVAITRFIPVVHNLLVLFGVRSPLADIYKVFH